MNTLLSIILLIASFCTFVVTQLYKEGTCPDDKTVVPNFQLERYLGVWYTNRRYMTLIEGTGKCTVSTYSLMDNGRMKMVIEQLNVSTDNPYRIYATAEVVENAKLFVTYDYLPDEPHNYWILDTDYNTYAVSYTCSNITGKPAQTIDMYSTAAWILTREKIPSPTVVEEAINVLRRNNIDLKYIKEVDQENCPSGSLDG